MHDETERLTGFVAGLLCRPDQRRNRHGNAKRQATYQGFVFPCRFRRLAPRRGADEG
jgi:hypothetical protein